MPKLFEHVEIVRHRQQDHPDLGLVLVAARQFRRNASTVTHFPIGHGPLMLLLALGAFSAGIRTCWDIAFLGLAMAFTVPAIGRLKNSTLVIFLLALVEVAIGAMFWPKMLIYCLNRVIKRIPKSEPSFL